MTDREFSHALYDMLEAIDGIQNAVLGKTREDYAKEWLLRSGVERGIEVISEASRALPDHMKALHPEIPWTSVRAIGNVIRHEYHRIADQVIWGVVEHELPRLRAALLAMKIASGTHDNGRQSDSE